MGIKNDTENDELKHSTTHKNQESYKVDFDQTSLISDEQVDLGSPRKPLDIAGAIQRYARIIFIFGTLSFISMLPIAISASSPYYMATGSILVERVQAPIIASSEQSPISNFFYDYAQTEVYRLGNVNILRKTLESLPKEAKNYYAPHGVNAAAVMHLRKSLTIGLIPNTHLIMVQMKSNVPRFATDIVNTLMHCYIDHARKVTENKDLRRITYLETERNALHIKVNKLTQELKQIANQTRTATFVEAYNVESMRLIELQKSLIVACRDMITSKNTLLAIENKADSIRKLSIEALSDELVAGDESLWSISYWTYKTLQEMRASIDGVSRTNPDRKYIESRMKAMKAYEAQLKESVTKRAKRIVHDKREYELNKEVLTAKSLAYAAQESFDDILQELQEQQIIAAENSRQIIEGQILETKLSQARNSLYAVETRLQELHAEAKSPVRASVEEFAQNSHEPAGTNLKKFIMLSFMASFGGIGCIFMTMELLDGRIRSNKDLISATEHAPSRSLALCEHKDPFWQVTAKHPHSEQAKSLRSLAIRLHKEREQNQISSAQISVFTGVSDSVGTSSIAINIARCLAGLGVKVLYMEAIQSYTSDMMHNETDINSLNKNTAVEDSKPFECILQSDKPLRCIRKPENELFDVISIGSDWGEGHDGQLDQVLNALRYKYDFIIVDTMPLHVSDLTEYMILEANIAILIIQAKRTTYNDLRKKLKLLWRLQVPVMTTILNYGGPLGYNKAEKILQLIPKKVLQFTMPHLLERNYTLDTKIRVENIWNNNA